MSATARSRPWRRGGTGRPALLAVQVLVPLALLAVWWFASSTSTNPFYPPLATILVRFQQLWLFDRFASDVVPSLVNLVVGLVAGVVGGITLGVVIGSSRRVGQVISPVLNFFRAIPPIALVPIVVSLLGFGVTTRIWTIALASLFPVLVATIDGLRSVDGQLHEVGAVFRLTRAERLFSVVLPAAGPRIASGAQVSLQTAFVVMIASEILGSSTGIGAQTLIAQQSFAIADMWTGILLLGVLGFAANWLFDRLRDRVLRWYVLSQALGKEG